MRNMRNVKCATQMIVFVLVFLLNIAGVGGLPAETVLKISELSEFDINEDGRVNRLDLVIVAQDVGNTTATNPRTDVNGDGEHNILDLRLVANNFNEYRN